MIRMDLARHFLRLSYALALAEFKARNEDSAFGILWYLLNPLLMFVLLLLVFGERLGAGIPHYPLYLLFGIIIFEFFIRTTNESARLIHSYRVLIKSVAFPRAALVGSVVMKALFSHAAEIVVFSIVMALFAVPPAGLALYPAVLVLLCLFSFGCALLLASITVFIADIEYVWAFLSRLLFFATPVFYAIPSGSAAGALNLANPLTHLITVARYLVIYLEVPPAWAIAGSVLSSLAMLAAGWLAFSALQKRFPERI
ncbi:ABC transporter permease [Candidatus Woesearchaeota archaeon]|nr:ABC transporter permease [Candidatus Woesearchaeota archaeon]